MEPDERSAPKQVIVMRRDLGMRRGKEIAQGAHASMIWLALRIRQPGNTFTEAERRWLDGAFTKVCVRVDSEEELLAVVQRAREAGVPSAALRRCGADRVPRRPDADLLRHRPRPPPDRLAWKVDNPG
jgi:PTH2 family peptidyl-tRNA hydrolase